MDDAEGFIKKNDATNLDLSGAADLFRKMFEEAVDEHASNEEFAEAKRMTRLATVGISIVCLIASLVIPLLIQIEQNTRSADSIVVADAADNDENDLVAAVCDAENAGYETQEDSEAEKSEEAAKA